MEGVVGRAKNPPLTTSHRSRSKTNEQSRTPRITLLGNEKSNWVRLGSHAANQ